LPPVQISTIRGLLESREIVAAAGFNHRRLGPQPRRVLLQIWLDAPMLGHGSPSSFALALASSAVLLCAVLAGSAVGQQSGPATLPAIAAPDEPPITPAQDPLRLRITWGGGEAGAWIGRAQVDRGTITNLTLLGLDADAAGSAWLEGGQLRIGDLTPHKSDSVEVTVEASPDAQLVVELASAPTATPVRAKVPLADLAKRPYQIRLDDRGNTLEIAIVPRPVVQLSIQRDSSQQDSLIFSPGQQLSFAATLELPGSLHGTTVDVQTTLHAARRTDLPPLWSDSQKLSVPVVGHPKIDLTVPLQQPDGVYTVRVTVSRPSGYFRDKIFAGVAAIADRTFDMVVVIRSVDSPCLVDDLDHGVGQHRIMLMQDIQENLPAIGILRKMAIRLQKFWSICEALLN
jgi:hypothetical protein